MLELKRLCIFIFATLISSCATSNNNLVRVNVNSIAGAGADSKKIYVLRPSDKEDADQTGSGH